MTVHPYRPTDEDRKMVAQPMDWPRWPFLPLKRATEHGLQAGFLMAVEEHRYTVFIGSIFRIPSCALAQIPGMFPEHHKYGSAEALFEAGWVVD